jgi:putative phage-type endonuclease
MSLDLNYKPVALVDIDGMPEEEWLRWRRKGIGGSDASVILGDSPWRTIVDLYNDKAGISPVIVEEDNAFAKDYGHTVEPLIAKWFGIKTGLEVYKDSNMYQHPLFPFMLADLDYRIRTPDGKEGILEIKSTSFRNSREWADGQIPVFYEEQGRHYMSVMNLDFIYYCCLWGNNFDSDSAMARLDRDLGWEEMLIQSEGAFWKQVQDKTPPTYDGADPDLALKSLRRYIGAGDKKIPEVTLEESFASNLDEIVRLSEEKAGYSDKAKQLEKQIDALSVPVIEKLKTAESGILELSDIVYRVKYPTRLTATFDRKKCAQLYPDVFAELSGQSASRKLKVQKVEKQAQATA